MRLSLGVSPRCLAIDGLDGRDLSLQLDELVVRAALVEQLVMGAKLGQLAVLQDEETMGVA